MSGRPEDATSSFSVLTEKDQQVGPARISAIFDAVRNNLPSIDLSSSSASESEGDDDDVARPVVSGTHAPAAVVASPIIPSSLLRRRSRAAREAEVRATQRGFADLLSSHDAEAPVTSPRKPAAENRAADITDVTVDLVYQQQKQGGDDIETLMMSLRHASGSLKPVPEQTATQSPPPVHPLTAAVVKTRVPTGSSGSSSSSKAAGPTPDLASLPWPGPRARPPQPRRQRRDAEATADPFASLGNLHPTVVLDLRPGQAGKSSNVKGADANGGRSSNDSGAEEDEDGEFSDSDDDDDDDEEEENEDGEEDQQEFWYQQRSTVKSETQRRARQLRRQRSAQLFADDPAYFRVRRKRRKHRINGSTLGTEETADGEADRGVSETPRQTPEQIAEAAAVEEARAKKQEAERLAREARIAAELKQHEEMKRRQQKRDQQARQAAEKEARERAEHQKRMLVLEQQEQRRQAERREAALEERERRAAAQARAARQVEATRSRRVSRHFLACVTADAVAKATVPPTATQTGAALLHDELSVNTAPPPPPSPDNTDLAMSAIWDDRESYAEPALPALPTSVWTAVQPGALPGARAAANLHRIAVLSFPMDNDALRIRLLALAVFQDAAECLDLFGAANLQLIALLQTERKHVPVMLVAVREGSDAAAPVTPLTVRLQAHAGAAFEVVLDDDLSSFTADLAFHPRILGKTEKLRALRVLPSTSWFADAIDTVVAVVTTNRTDAALAQCLCSLLQRARTAGQTLIGARLVWTDDTTAELALAWRGVDALSRIPALIGPADPLLARASAPDSLAAAATAPLPITVTRRADAATRSLARYFAGRVPAGSLLHHPYQLRGLVPTLFVPVLSEAVLIVDWLWARCHAAQIVAVCQAAGLLVRCFDSLAATAVDTSVPSSWSAAPLRLLVVVRGEAALSLLQHAVLPALPDDAPVLLPAPDNQQDVLHRVCGAASRKVPNRYAVERRMANVRVADDLDSFAVVTLTAAALQDTTAAETLSQILDQLRFVIIGCRVLTHLTAFQARELTPFPPDHPSWRASVAALTGAPAMLLLVRGRRVIPALEARVGATRVVSLSASSLRADVPPVLVSASCAAAVRLAALLFSERDVWQEPEQDPMQPPVDASVGVLTRLALPQPVLCTLGIVRAPVLVQHASRRPIPRILRLLERHGFDVAWMQLQPGPELRLVLQRTNALAVWHSLTSGLPSDPYTLAAQYGTDGFYASPDYQHAMQDVAATEMMTPRSQAPRRRMLDRSHSRGTLTQSACVILLGSEVDDTARILGKLVGDLGFAVTGLCKTLVSQDVAAELVRDRCGVPVASFSSGPIVAIALQRDNALARLHEWMQSTGLSDGVIYSRSTEQAERDLTSLFDVLCDSLDVICDAGKDIAQLVEPSSQPCMSHAA